MHLDCRIRGGCTARHTSQRRCCPPSAVTKRQVLLGTTGLWLADAAHAVEDAVPDASKASLLPSKQLLPPIPRVQLADDLNISQVLQGGVRRCICLPIRQHDHLHVVAIVDILRTLIYKFATEQAAALC